MREWGKTWLAFGVIEGKCLLFPLAILAGLAFTQAVQIPFVARYDAMLLYCVAIQWWMVRRGMETTSELRAVCVFHILGLALELERTSRGAWSYPDPGLLRIGPVPLFSGFMYASIASYILQAWRRFDLSFERLPSAWISAPLAIAGYLSFFIARESRYLLIALILLSLWRAKVFFSVRTQRFSMPLGVSFAGIGVAIWIGENAGTYLGAWRYPHQMQQWHPVEGTKAAAWFLLVVVGFLIIERYKAWRAWAEQQSPFLTGAR